VKERNSIVTIISVKLLQLWPVGKVIF